MDKRKREFCMLYYVEESIEIHEKLNNVYEKYLLQELSPTPKLRTYKIIKTDCKP